MLIIGAGVAGLAAACELVKHGLTPLVLEARPRTGGRIHTLRQIDATTIELGAEFVHGKPREVERFAREHHLAQHAVADEHWRMDRGRFQPLGDFWGKLAQVFEELPCKGGDKSYCEFLKQARNASAESRALATDFVEGFHAADPKRISSLSIAQSESASEKIEGTKQFRFIGGYSELARAMEARAIVGGTRIICRYAVLRVEWKPQRVVVFAKSGDEVARFEAETLVIALPLGVLQSGTVQFNPPLLQKAEAIRALAMGNVLKVNLQIRAGLWPDEKEGFIHLTGEQFPTWWKYRNVVTAWAGGPRADKLATRSSMEILHLAMQSLAHMFGIRTDTVASYVESAQYHDWRNDPFARGAYSYVPVGAMRARAVLARPIKKTMFFAGEATARQGFQGTVHGAVESGIRAAREIVCT